MITDQPGVPPPYVDLLSESDMVSALAALANAHRLRVFRSLVFAGPAGLSAGAIAAQLGMPASSLSFHLKELARAGLVVAQAKGKYLVYRPQFAQARALVDYLLAHCCEGTGAAADCKTC